MIKRYSSFGALAKHFESVLLTERVRLVQSLEDSCILLENSAKEKFGKYQTADGEYPAWAELKTATKKQRVRAGYTPNDPLLRDGTLKESIHHSVDNVNLTAIVGSNDKIMAYQEMGTATIPPRPVLGPTAYKHANDVVNIIQRAAFKGLNVKTKKIAEAGNDRSI